MSKYDKWYIIGKLLCSTFRICKKICKFAKIEFFIAKSSYIVKMFAKLVQFVSLCQRLSKKLNFIKIWQVEVGQNKDLVCYRKNQSFRQCAWGLRQLVLKPGFRPKRGLWVCKKSQKISTASDQYFLSYVKKLQGSNWPPPPAGIGLKVIFFILTVNINIWHMVLHPFFQGFSKFKPFN